MRFIEGANAAVSDRWARALALCAVVAGMLSGGLPWDGAHAGPALDRIAAQGSIKAAVGRTPGFFSQTGDGRWEGFFIDIGRALAIATLGDPDKIAFAASSPQQRLPALEAGEVDVLLSGVSVTMTRALRGGIRFGPPVFYDGQGILVRKDLGVTRAADLDGITIGVQSGTTGELNIADFFHKVGKPVSIFPVEDTRQFIAVLEEGRVDAITQDSADLVGKLRQIGKPDNFILLPERLSKEPLAPAVAGGDERWHDIVTWTVNALIQAEEWGITSQNVDTFLASQDPAIRRFLGEDPALAEAVGLDPRWAYNIIRQVGNYGELFERHLKPLGWERGYNSLWTDGGLLYAPPFR